jgi:hypothetical protein
MLPWLASWGALLLACIVAAGMVWLGVQVARLPARIERERPCGLPVVTSFGLYLGRCVRRDDHKPDECAHE